MRDKKPTTEVKRTDDGLYNISIGGARWLRFDAQTMIDLYEYGLRNMRQLEADARQDEKRKGEEDARQLD